MLVILIDLITICATTSVGFVAGFYFERWMRKRDI